VRLPGTAGGQPHRPCGDQGTPHQTQGGAGGGATVAAWCDDYVEEADRRKLKLAVASSSGRRWVVGHLERLGVAHRFDAIKTADDVERVKPAPDLYLAAVAALGLKPYEAIALEDAPNGLHAAKRAGLFCVAIPNALTGRLPLDHADLRLVSLAHTPLDALLAAVEERLER
jgi:beta-phosphoglucomutase-like phosphatase (HAD superfamily)